MPVSGVSAATKAAPVPENGNYWPAIRLFSRAGRPPRSATDRSLTDGRHATIAAVHQVRRRVSSGGNSGAPPPLLIS